MTTPRAFEDYSESIGGGRRDFTEGVAYGPGACLSLDALPPSGYLGLYIVAFVDRLCDTCYYRNDGGQPRALVLLFRLLVCEEVGC